MTGGTSRRDVLARGGSLSVSSVAVVGTSAAVAYAASRTAPDGVTIEYDEETIKKYQPRLILDGVSPEPLAFHALHAESQDSSMNAVYGFVRYPYQDGATQADSHLGDHEPLIVFYDAANGDVVRVDYAAYHWFRAWAEASAFKYADDAENQPILRVDPTYHHYYLYQGEWPGTQLEVRDLTESLDSWLNNGMAEELATSQPYNPWAMLGRESWWKHTAGNWFDALGKSLWFNLGLSGARSTSDLSGVSTW